MCVLLALLASITVVTASEEANHDHIYVDLEYLLLIWGGVYLSNLLAHWTKLTNILFHIAFGCICVNAKILPEAPGEFLATLSGKIHRITPNSAFVVLPDHHPACPTPTCYSRDADSCVPSAERRLCHRIGHHHHHVLARPRRRCQKLYDRNKEGLGHCSDRCAGSLLVSAAPARLDSNPNHLVSIPSISFYINDLAEFSPTFFLSHSLSLPQAFSPTGFLSHNSLSPEN